MKGNIVFCLLCFAVFMIFAVCTACGGGGGGGGASLYDPNSGPHNGGGGGSWGGVGASGNASGTNGSTTPNATIVLTGGTSLGVQYYTYKGQNYYSAQDLLDVLGNENITGTVDIPLVAADGSSRVAKYVVTDRGRTLKHPYKITLNNTDGTALFDSTSTSGSTEYFYASEGFPMSKITTTETPVTINSSNVDFPITAWNINGATVAADGTLIGFGEGTTLEAAPVAKKYFVDDNGTLYINPTAVANGETIKITAADGPIQNIKIDGNSRVALDLSEANIVDGGGTPQSTWTSSILNAECATALTSIKLPNSITSIGAEAFQNYSNLQSVTLQNGVTSIGINAFKDCSSLASINIPNGVTSIGTDAFKLCCNLTSINIPNGVTTIADGAFAGAALKSVTIPASVTFIDTSAFDYCYSLESVTFNGSLTFGQYNVFEHCTSLTSINLPEGITEIPEGLFRDCTNLKHVGIPSTVTSIKTSAFAGCSALTSITIPSTVTTIGYEAFKGTGLTSIVIPPSVTSLDSTAFNDCSALKTATVPIGVSGDAFSSSSGMKASVEELKLTRTIETEIPAGLCGLIPDGGIDSYTTPLKKAILPEGITRIESRAFRGCKNLVSINIPSSVTSIGDAAFDHCFALPSIVVPTTITQIEGWQYGNLHITTVVIPDTVITIKYYAFCGCAELQTVTIGSGVQTMEQAVFDGCVNAYFIFKKDPQSISYINYVTHFPEGARAEWTDNGVTHTYHWHWTGSSGSWIQDS